MVLMFAINLKAISIAHNVINGYYVHKCYFSNCFHFTVQFAFAEVTYTLTLLLSWIIWITENFLNFSLFYVKFFEKVLNFVLI